MFSFTFSGKNLDVLWKELGKSLLLSILRVIISNDKFSSKFLLSLSDVFSNLNKWEIHDYI